MTEHTYPDNYPPGAHWATDAAWEILDSVKPGLISHDVRAWLAGNIAGRLIRERNNDGLRKAGMCVAVISPGRAMDDRGPDDVG